MTALFLRAGDMPRATEGTYGLGLACQPAHGEET